MGCYDGGGSDTCSWTLWGWAHGSMPLILPEEAGFRIGPNGITTVVLQVHYDNRALISGMVDTSGIRVYYTDQLRTHDATALTIGDPVVSGYGLSRHRLME